MESRRYMYINLLIGIALCNCQLFESQRYMFINSAFNVLFVFYRIIEVLCLFYLLHFDKDLFKC